MLVKQPYKRFAVGKLSTEKHSYMSPKMLVIWYVVVRPKRLMIVYGEQSSSHSGEVSTAASYLGAKCATLTWTGC
jgi:hypothetical protein